MGQPGEETKPPRAVIEPTALYAVTLGTFFAASSAPTPLYRFYQEAFALSPVLVTLVFAVYAVALLKALLVAGSLSDHLGRKPVIFAALLLEAAGMVLFLAAHDLTGLLLARIVQGIATGIAAASIGAALVDVDRVRGQLVNSLAPLLGMAVGALGTSALVQFAPLPLHLIYLVLLVAFLLQAVAIWLVPETARRRAGAFASLRPRIRIPAQVKRPLALVTPINLANWALGGFYLSLVPTLVVSATGSHAAMTGGAVVAALMLSGGAAVLLRRARSSEANLAAGVVAMLSGLVIVLAGVHLGLVPVIIFGTLVSGAGFGTSFLGSVGGIMPLAKPDERAGLLSAYYVQSYLAFSIPAILAGYLTGLLGIARTADIYAAAIIVMSAAGLLALRAARARRSVSVAKPCVVD
jgi:MFS family permease